MFGYIRPQKADLLMREFTRYRSVYCGICKALSDRYGQIPRLALTYDLTFFALLFLSLSKKDAELSMEGCFLNPLRKKPVTRNHPVLDLTADVTMLLAGNQMEDDVTDEGGLKPRVTSLVFRRGYRRARSCHPMMAAGIERALDALTRAEMAPVKADAVFLSNLFGVVLETVFAEAAGLLDTDESIRAALTLTGHELGAWIYLIDAVDDYDLDMVKGRFNALPGTGRMAAAASVAAPLEALEASLDRTLALLPYERDGGIMKNIALMGLPSVRRAVFEGQKLTRL